jgi:hypothetical protein
MVAITPLSKQLQIIQLVLCTALWSVQLPALSEPTGDANPSTSPSTAPQPVVLQGGVKHKEYLEPVPPSLMAGAQFDEQALPKLIPTNNWIPIPAWLAGTWQFKTENVTDMVNYTKENYTKPPYTIRNETQKIFGQQQDKTGQIWHYLKVPYSYTTKLNHGILGYERIIGLEALSYNEEAVVLRLTGSDTQVNPKSHIVTSTDQAEDINHYSQLGKDGIVISGSAKHFDMNGQPTMDMTSNLMGRLLKPFAELDEQDGDNLKLLFAEFLKSQGKADLLPSSN